MQILIISHYFAPYQVMGAIRMSKLAKYWHGCGHEVRVIAGNNQPFPRTLPLEIPVSQVYYTHWLYFNGLERLFTRKSAGTSPQSAPTPSSGRNLRELATFYFKTLTNFPDGYIGWYPWALSMGRELLRSWRPDFILASAPPNTGMMVASRLSQEFGVPWFADFRDLWMDDPRRAYPFEYPSWREGLEQRLERHTLRSASGFTTVSEPLARILRGRYPQPTQTVMNGFDPDDYLEPPTDQLPSEPRALQVLYPGQLFVGGTDPSPLLEAMARLKPHCLVELRFFAPPQLRQDPARFESKFRAYSDYVMSLAGRYGVAEQVSVQPPVPFGQSLQAQRAADVLLLLVRRDPSERGTFTGKFFEYVGASRPILAIGPEDNVAVEMVRERSLGLSSSHPAEIASWLERLVEHKRQGRVPGPPEAAKQGLARSEQFEVLEQFIRQQLER